MSSRLNFCTALWSLSPNPGTGLGSSPMSTTSWPASSYAWPVGEMLGKVTGSPIMGWSMTVALTASIGVSRSNWMRPMLFSVAWLCQVKDLVWVCRPTRLRHGQGFKYVSWSPPRLCWCRLCPPVFAHRKGAENGSHPGVLAGLGPWAVARIFMVSSSILLLESPHQQFPMWLLIFFQNFTEPVSFVGLGFCWFGRPWLPSAPYHGNLGMHYCFMLGLCATRHILDPCKHIRVSWGLACNR